jgi:photosystem II stability/assembly factor-like uncharacterized protein
MKKLIIPLLLILLLAACTGNPETPAVYPPTATPKPLTSSLIESPQLDQFYFFNETDGWGATQTKIVRTNDGGVTWYDVTPPIDAQFGYAPYVYLDAQTAWVLLPVNYFDSGSLYQTSNGGLSWTSVKVPFAVAGLQLLDAQTAFALASQGAGAGSQAVAVFSTTDAGKTWARVFTNDPTVNGSQNSLPLGGSKSGFAFTDPLNGWVGGSIPIDNNIYLYRTQDGGASWKEFPLALPAGYQSAQTGNEGPIFFSATEGILPVHLVMPLEPGNLSVFYRTSDGGATWSSGQVIKAGRVYDFRSFREGVAWGEGQFYFTSDSGQTWGAVVPNVDFSDTIESFQFVNALVGWVLVDQTGGNPALYKTTDGGATWTLLIE